MDSNVKEVIRLSEERRLALGAKDFERAEKLHTEMAKALGKVKSQPESPFGKELKDFGKSLQNMLNCFKG